MKPERNHADQRRLMQILAEQGEEMFQSRNGSWLTYDTAHKKRTGRTLVTGTYRTLADLAEELAVLPQYPRDTWPLPVTPSEPSREAPLRAALLPLGLGLRPYWPPAGERSWLIYYLARPLEIAATAATWEQLIVLIDQTDFSAMLDEYGMTKYADMLRNNMKAAEADAELTADYPVDLRPSPIHGQGTFVTHPIRQGALVAPARVAGSRTIFGWYVNHGAIPNVAFLHAGGEDFDWVALKNLEPGDEVLADYRQVIRAGLAYSAGCEPQQLSMEHIRSSILRMWVKQECPL